MISTWFLRHLAIVILCCSLFIPGNAFGQYLEEKEETGEQMYTAYNIWIWSAHNMKCLNYKGARNRIPIGTEIKNIQIVDFTDDMFMHEDELNFDRIEFSLANKRRKYTISFNPRYHPGTTIKDYIRYMFTPKTLEEVSSAFTPFEAAAIKEGVISQGMRKDAVLACYGPPSERNTRGLDNNTWVYFINKRNLMKIHFAKNPASGLMEVQTIDLVPGGANKTGMTSYPRTVAAVSRPAQKPKVQSAPKPKAMPEKQTNDVEYKLKKVKAFYEKGLITEEEYKTKRQQILDAF